jgi:hypothetical protein
LFWSRERALEGTNAHIILEIFENLNAGSFALPAGVRDFFGLRILRTNSATQTKTMKSTKRDAQSGKLGTDDGDPSA